jgi:hypothetical protein
MVEVNLPHRFVPRAYQLPFLRRPCAFLRQLVGVLCVRRIVLIRAAFAMTDSARVRQLVVATLSAASLAACTTSGGNSGDIASSLLVAPGTYMFYNCAQISGKASGFADRQKVLERLMAKAGPGVDGRMVSAIAYQPEYIANRGEINELRRAAAEKKCESVSGAEKSVAPTGGSKVK